MKQEEQNNTMLYVVVFIGLIVIGVVKAVFAGLFAGADTNAIISGVVAEIVGAALMGGLFVYIIQNLTGISEKLGDRFEVFTKEQERMRTVQEKILATGTQPAISPDAVKSAAQKPTPAPVSTPEPEPVVAAPTPHPPPPPPPKDPLEAQLEQELGAIHFDDMFAEYQHERDEAIARGESLDDDGGTFISDKD